MNCNCDYLQQGYGDQLQTGPVVYGQQQYQAQPSVIMAQPNVYVSQGPLNPPVKDYLGYSIFTLLCCCLPLGIIALIYSTSVSKIGGIIVNIASVERCTIH